MSEATQKARINTAELSKLDVAHLIHPHRPAGPPDQVIMERGNGCRVWDMDGREYLDANAGLALTNVGHGREEIAEAAHRQMLGLEYFPSFWEFANRPSIELAARLVGLTPERLQKVFFTSGGSEGVETAMRMARFYHYQRGRLQRSVFLSRSLAYHGVGYGSGSLTGFDDFHVGFAPNLPDIQHLTPPWPFRRDLFGGQDPTDFCVAELEQVIDRIGPERIAAFVGEPVMGVAGMVIPPEDYWPRIQAVLREHGILLISDEVITGYGRTGRWFASPRFGANPDIMVTAKGLTSGYAPLGAVLVTDEIAAHLDTGSDGFPIGFSYTGHPVCCAVAMANLDIIEREHLIERADRLGRLLMAGLASLADLPVVGEVRGVGLMLAMELVSNKSERTPLQLQFRLPDAVRTETGVIMRCEGNVASIAPPFVLDESQAKRIVDAIRGVLERIDTEGALH
jgi:putrescine aminotransferase